MAAEGQEANALNASQKRGREEEGGDKKWPGWPGENVFRLIVPLQKVGSIIGRKGEFVKKMCEETRSRIKVLDGVPGTNDRVVMVSAREDPDAGISPAMDGLLKVHRRIIEGTEGDRESTGIICSKILVAATQAGSLIGRQGSVIKSIQDSSGTIVRVMPVEDLPLFALQDDRVVEVQGEPSKVHNAMELIVKHLRKFLVDRSVLQLFEMNRAAQSQGQQNVSWGHNTAAALPNSSGPSLGGGSHYSSSTLQHDNYYQTDLLDSQNHHHGVSMYGRDPVVGGLSSSVVPPPPAPVITQVTQQMQIPLSYADAIIGAAGANISYMRKTSGATITIQESRGAPSEMTVEIHGTSSQVETAQRLIQNFMSGGSTGPNSAYNSTDVGYNSYNHPQSSFYSSSAGVGGHPTGAYGSPYSSSYAY